MALLPLLLGASCGVAAAAGAAPLPLLTIGPNTTAWPPPNPNAFTFISLRPKRRVSSSVIANPSCPRPLRESSPPTLAAHSG